MKCTSILLTSLFTVSHSFVTLSLDEIKKNAVNEFSSDTMRPYPLTNSADEETFKEEKNWLYPVESKQVNSEGQKLKRILSQFNVHKFDQMEPSLKQLMLFLIESSKEEAKLTNFDKKSFETVNDTLLKLSTLQDKLVLMRDVNLLSNLLDSSSKLSALDQEGLIDGLYFNPGSLKTTSNSERGVYEDGMKIVNEVEQLDRIRYFFEELCRKHHSMLSKLSIEHNHYPSSDSNKLKKISIF